MFDNIPHCHKIKFSDSKNFLIIKIWKRSDCTRYIQFFLNKRNCLIWNVCSKRIHVVFFCGCQKRAKSAADIKNIFMIKFRIQFFYIIDSSQSLFLYWFKILLICFSILFFVVLKKIGTFVYFFFFYRIRNVHNRAILTTSVSAEFISGNYFIRCFLIFLTNGA